MEKVKIFIISFITVALHNAKSNGSVVSSVPFTNSTFYVFFLYSVFSLFYVIYFLFIALK